MFVVTACVVSLCFGANVPVDTTARVDSVPFVLTLQAPRGEARPAVGAMLDSVADTTVARRRRRAVAVEYSDWYSRRLTIHRWASYTTLPLFVGNYVTGEQLLNKGNLAPRWAIRSHGPMATAVATLFAVNTITGGMNLWAGRQDPAGRGWRTTHAILMLVADGGFTAAGILSNSAERSDQKRHLHRTIALSSIGVSLVSYIMMIPPFRRD